MEEFGRLKLDFFKSFLENWLTDIKLRTEREGAAGLLVNRDGSDTKYPQRYGGADFMW
jgi:hypothetical protein